MKRLSDEHLKDYMDYGHADHAQMAAELLASRKAIAVMREAMSAELKAMGVGNCCCGADTDDGTDVICYLHEGLLRVDEILRGDEL